MYFLKDEISLRWRYSSSVMVYHAMAHKDPNQSECTVKQTRVWKNKVFRTSRVSLEAWHQNPEDVLAHWDLGMICDKPEPFLTNLGLSLGWKVFCDVCHRTQCCFKGYCPLCLSPACSPSQEGQRPHVGTAEKQTEEKREKQTHIMLLKAYVLL